MYTAVCELQYRRGSKGGRGPQPPCEKSGPLWPPTAQVKLMTQAYCEIMYLVIAIRVYVYDVLCILMCNITLVLLLSL